MWTDRSSPVHPPGDGQPERRLALLDQIVEGGQVEVDDQGFGSPRWWPLPGRPGPAATSLSRRSRIVTGSRPRSSASSSAAARRALRAQHPVAFPELGRLDQGSVPRRRVRASMLYARSSPDEFIGSLPRPRVRGRWPIEGEEPIGGRQQRRPLDASVGRGSRPKSRRPSPGAGRHGRRIGSNEPRPTKTSSEKLRPLPLVSAAPSSRGRGQCLADRHGVVRQPEVGRVQRHC